MRYCMTLPFLFDVKFDAAMVGVGASHRDRRQIVEHRVGVLLNGLLLIGPCPVSNMTLPWAGMSANNAGPIGRDSAINEGFERRKGIA